MVEGRDAEQVLIPYRLVSLTFLVSPPFLRALARQDVPFTGLLKGGNDRLTSLA